MVYLERQQYFAEVHLKDAEHRCLLTRFECRSTFSRRRASQTQWGMNEMLWQSCSRGDSEWGADCRGSLWHVWIWASSRAGYLSNSTNWWRSSVMWMSAGAWTVVRSFVWNANAQHWTSDSVLPHCSHAWYCWRLCVCAVRYCVYCMTALGLTFLSKLWSQRQISLPDIKTDSLNSVSILSLTLPPLLLIFWYWDPWIL